MAEEAIARAAARLMAVRNPHRDLAAAINRLIDKRCADPLAGIPVVTTDELLDLLGEDDYQPALTYHPPGVEFAPLPDAGGRPPSLVDRYGDSGATHAHAMDRLAAAGLRHGYHLGNTRICWGCSGPVDPVDLSCSCYTPARTKENA